MQTTDMHSQANAVHNNFISNLESTFSKSLCIRDDQKSEHASEGNFNCDVTVKTLCEGSRQQDVELNKKCLKKCSTFPDPDMMLPPSSSDDEDEKANTSLAESLSNQSAHQTYTRSISLPLVSAIKGSREKQGGSHMKLTVKWAPDVYDPVPTSVCHTVKSRKQQKSRNKKNEKKNGKKGLKGNSSRGGGGKDKKQFRKITGTSDFCYKLPDSHDKVIETSTGLDAVDVGSQDSYCGTSFLKKSVTKVHYSVAEAL